MKEFEFDFERLKVYEKALDFIDEIFKIYKDLNQEFKYAIGSNMVRAGLSIANNIAEGNDKKSLREKNRFFNISSDSARECVSVLNILKRQKLVDNSLYQELRLMAREITSMLKGLTKD
ncbi:MAG: four helix bundle protein [Candidatus Omnitrophica bacterium]|nr:four helix bundle protein [Candidatus Omnitrophota bacterium]